MITDCDEDLETIVSIAGDYTNHECTLVINEVTAQDAGTWVCDMEEYKFGDWVSGTKHTSSIMATITEDENKPEEIINDDEEHEKNPEEIIDDDDDNVEHHEETPVEEEVGVINANGTDFHDVISNFTSILDTTFGMVRLNQENTIDVNTAVKQGDSNEIIGRVVERVF